MNANPFANGSSIFTQNGYYICQFELLSHYSKATDRPPFCSAVRNVAVPKRGVQRGLGVYRCALLATVIPNSV